MGGAGAGGAGSGAGWATGCAVACGMASLGENHVGVPGSAASGTLGAQAGTEIGGGALGLGVAAAASAGRVGAHVGRAGGPGCEGDTGGWTFAGAAAAGGAGGV